MKTIFGREPAWWAALFAVFLQMVSAFGLDLSVETQGLVNALVTAILGFVVAAAVSAEQAVPALVGVFKAGIAVALAFGLHLAPEAQSSFLLFAELLLTGLFVRPVVTAPVPARAPA
jgi:hypothetical protein